MICGVLLYPNSVLDPLRVCRRRPCCWIQKNGKGISSFCTRMSDCSLFALLLPKSCGSRWIGKSPFDGSWMTWRLVSEQGWSLSVTMGPIFIQVLLKLRWIGFWRLKQRSSDLELCHSASLPAWCFQNQYPCLDKISIKLAFCFILRVNRDPKGEIHIWGVFNGKGGAAKKGSWAAWSISKVSEFDCRSWPGRRFLAIRQGWEQKFFFLNGVHYLKQLRYRRLLIAHIYFLNWANIYLGCTNLKTHRRGRVAVKYMFRK